MADNALLDRNLIALSARHPDLASQLSSAKPLPGLAIDSSRKGPPVPVLPREGRPFHLHSRFDPVSEGRRLADKAPDGFLVAFGLGGGYHLTPLLEKTSTTGLLVVEKDLSLMRGIFEAVDLTRLLSDSRVVILVDPDPRDLSRFILERYIPVLYGNLGSLTLRARWDADPAWFSARAEALKDLPEELGRDYTVQARFGRRWFVHTMANLPRSEETTTVLPPFRRLIVTAAGPSLQGAIPRIRALMDQGSALLATDTSLPVLASAGIEPDIVLSIDCQVVSYHHFLKGLPKKTTLILDLASPPLLTRLSDRVLFFSSGHPFSLYMNQLYRPFPILDLSGGNVTHAAASLAQTAGAEELYLFGADFSYPSGLPYAKGTYVYPYFQSRSGRMSGAEDGFWKFISASRPRKELCGDSWRLRTASMDHYRESLNKAIQEMDFQVIQEDGPGVPLESVTRTRPSRLRRIVPVISAGPVTVGWSEFLDDYRQRLLSLPPLSGPPQDYLEALGSEDRQAWATLLPSAATFRTESSDGPSAVEEARLWTLKRIENQQFRRQSASQRIDP